MARRGPPPNISRMVSLKVKTIYILECSINNEIPERKKLIKNT